MTSPLNVQSPTFSKYSHSLHASFFLIFSIPHLFTLKSVFVAAHTRSGKIYITPFFFPMNSSILMPSFSAARKTLLEDKSIHQWKLCCQNVPLRTSDSSNELGSMACFSHHKCAAVWYRALSVLLGYIKAHLNPSAFRGEYFPCAFQIRNLALIQSPLYSRPFCTRMNTFSPLPGKVKRAS